ncbi:MAG: carbon-nitrogen hydrolase family protein [Deltaproteobacteria bacterium]|nr:carbon-nitrogen hydrolase family protein [Deltaproteobacteria bacterium]
MSRIALAQTTTTDDLKANLEAAEAMVRDAAAGGADLLAFPEVFLYIGGRKGKLEVAEFLEGPLVGRFREAAARLGMMILLGSLHERIADNPDRIYNTSVLIDRQGQVLAHYRKLHMFDIDLPNLVMKESDTVQPGPVLPPVVQTDIGRVGLSICFDLRFSELYRHLRTQGAEVIFIPANFTATTGAAHWEVLLRARAVETQTWVAAPAQWGPHNPRFRSFGHSALIDPWGEVKALKPEGAGLVFGEIDLELVKKVRRELPMGVPEV